MRLTVAAVLAAAGDAHTLRIAATNAAGQRSSAHKLTFTIVP
jgi:hypothetical protein